MNEITRVPEELNCLTSLTLLDIQHNPVKTVPDNFESLLNDFIPSVTTPVKKSPWHRGLYIDTGKISGVTPSRGLGRKQISLTRATQNTAPVSEHENV
jgi:Leucine-rich repeat (LRR) protein